MKKRWISLICFVTLAIFLTACSSGSPETVIETRTIVQTVEVRGESSSEIVQVTREVAEDNYDIAATMAATPADMFFENAGTNPFIDTEDDNLSTFAVDVDTGSYTLMRSYLNSGTLPPKDSVRIEEYVNYFNQDYAMPEQGAFAIHVEGAQTPYGESDSYYTVRVGIQGYQEPNETRPDALLIFVVDTSGSMEQGGRLEMVKHGLRTLLHQLRPSDRVGIVEYGSRARVILSPTYTSERQRIADAIEMLSPNGSTNAEEGIMLAYQMADEYALPDQINRLILNSDGVANVGNTTAEAILAHAHNNISLSSFGYGLGNYNDALMEQLADQGDGVYAYIDSRAEAERLFHEKLTGTLYTIARDAKIQVIFNPTVVARYRLLGFENRAVADEDFRNDSVDAGEIGSGHNVTALYEVKLVDDVSLADTAMTVQVRYDEPDSGEIIELRGDVTTADFMQSFASASPRFQQDVVVAEFAELLKGSFWAQNSSWEQLQVDAMRIAEYLPADPQVQELANLVARAASLNE